MGIRTSTFGSGPSVVVAAFVVVALMVVLVPNGVASAAAPAAAADGATWAYGNVVSTSFHGTTASGVPYTGNATYGYTVLIHQTNFSGSEFELTVDRTMGAAFAVEYCSPTCSSPKYYSTLSDRLWENINATTGFTNAGTVNENGAAVRAFALMNSSTLQQANFTEATHSYLPNVLGIGVTRSGHVFAQVGASASITFGPPLGLFPTNLSSAQHWNSSAPFQAVANASYDYLATHSGPLANWNLTGYGYFPVERSGNVTVLGSSTPANSIVLGGVTYPEVGLTILGPFSVREGFILVPTASDLFAGSSSLPWSANASGEATVGMSYLDVRPVAQGHFGLGASEWIYDSESLEPTSAAPASSGITDLAGGGAAPAVAPQTVVQGQPQSTAQSSTAQSCLMTGSGCPSSSTPAGFHGIVGLLAAGVVVVLVVGLIAVVVERRRMPPPTYPNSSLYPPGNSVRPSTGRGPTPPEVPPAEDDPLGNLW